MGSCKCVGLITSVFMEERIHSATFPPPSPADGKGLRLNPQHYGKEQHHEQKPLSFRSGWQPTTLENHIIADLPTLAVLNLQYSEYLFFLLNLN